MAVPGKNGSPSVLRFFHPVLPARQLGAKPQRVIIDNHPIVLFRDNSGLPAALNDICPHRNAPLSKGKLLANGRIACPYHGWNFDRNGNGRSPSQPSLSHCDTRAYQVLERWNYLWVADCNVPITDFPALESPGFEYAGSFRTLFKAPLHVCLDNFSEDEHFPEVHLILGWNREAVSQIEYQAQSLPDKSVVHYSGPQRPNFLLPTLGLHSTDRLHNHWVNYFNPIYAVYNLSWQNTKTGEPRPFQTRFAIFMVPESDKITRFHSFAFVATGNSKYLKLLMPILKPAMRLLGRLEIGADAHFIPNVADTPLSLKGMRLGKYDKTVIHNRKLLQSLYWGQDTPLISPVVPPAELNLAAASEIIAFNDEFDPN